MDRAAQIRTVWAEKYQADLPDPDGKVKPYQANFCAEIETRFGFAGKRVLEVGGSLNRDYVLKDLGVKCWVGVQETSYWASIGRDYKTAACTEHASFDAANPTALAPYQVVTAPIESLPEQFYGAFDLVISMAAFTFIQKVGPAIDKCYRALMPGGGFGMLAAQIWSSESGLFFHTVKDKMGRLFSSYPHEGHSNPVPAWGHLLMRPADLYDYLNRSMDCEAAGDIVYEVFSSRRINRCFTEDYLAYFDRSPFRRYGKIDTQLVAGAAPDAKRLKELEARNPGYRDFTTQMILAYGQRTT